MQPAGRPPQQRRQKIQKSRGPQHAHRAHEPHQCGKNLYDRVESVLRPFQKLLVYIVLLGQAVEQDVENQQRDDSVGQKHHKSHVARPFPSPRCMILQKATATRVLTQVAMMAGPTIAVGSAEPYWLR